VDDQKVQDFLSLYDENEDKKFDKKEAFEFLHPMILAQMRDSENAQPAEPETKTFEEQEKEDFEKERTRLNEVIELNFVHFDKDNTGYLEPSEIKAFLQAVNKEFGEERQIGDEQVNDFLTAFDDDGDKKFNKEEAFEFLLPLIVAMEQKDQ
jgi:Ca2+-binding EF-hand superfamily protein